MPTRWHGQRCRKWFKTETTVSTRRLLLAEQPGQAEAFASWQTALRHLSGVGQPFLRIEKWTAAWVRGPLVR